MHDLLAEPAHQVSPRAVAYWRTTTAFGWVVLLGVLGAAWRIWWDHVAWPAWALAAIAAWAVVHVLVMPPIRFRVHRWESTPTAVRTRTGWVGREHRVAPVSRIQTVDTSQGVVHRAFGLATVTVTTASSAGPVTIEALDKDVADRLVAELTATTAATRGDAT